MASCKNDLICTLLIQFFYSFLSVQLIWKNFAPGRSPPTSKFMRHCLCLACVQTYPISSGCNKGNRRRLHAGKSRIDPRCYRCGFKSNRWSRDQVDLVPRAFHPFFEGKALGKRLEIRCNQVSPTRLQGSMLGGCDCTKAIESLPRRVFALKWRQKAYRFVPSSYHLNDETQVK